MGGRAVKHRGGIGDARGHRVWPAGGSRRYRAAVGLAALLGLAGLLGSACSAAAPAAPKPASSASASPARSATTPDTPAATPRAPAASVTLAAVGDMMLGDTPDLPPDPGTYFDAVKSRLDSGAQIVFGNLEGTLTTATASKCGASGPSQDCFAFKNPPRYIRYFKDAGFTVLNDANNHSFDFGAAGQAQTVRTIHRAGLAQTGLPGEITVVTANGIKVAFAAFAPYDYDASLLDLPAARALVEKAAREAPIVVVYMHAGAEGSDADHVTGREEIYLGEDRGNAEAFAHMAIDAGASLVIASGPHVLRGLQFYRGHLIAYSLGNFAGYNNFGMTGDLGLSAILHVTLSPAGQFVRARIYPVQFTGQGQPVPGGGSVAFMARLSEQDFGPTAARILPSGAIQAP
jgi:poly-gamma-glutamate capsule biosynthesis protein CapA/YwtB (metallophosphatase superfamily)